MIKYMKIDSAFSRESILRAAPVSSPSFRYPNKRKTPEQIRGFNAATGATADRCR